MRKDIICLNYNGIVVTKEGITLFSTIEDGKLLKQVHDFKDISKLEIHTISDLESGTMDSVEEMFAFKILMLYIYDNSGNLVDIPVVSLEKKDREAFENKLLELWQEAHSKKQ